ncbi:MAG: hypothetical protein A3G03_01255 [Candidatus Taylorbacteria bacterium RIFCSPLOWO2_12_FULL_44_15c]|uniref:Cohesin domain-containing protein n=1 Tax=Candidatus Taylorbacteria bacterium RIFCSPLOWO2_12_FULL_44_15c TaxID=1802333 RepID=A0A1G2P4Z3_9BACT|nr:MAG: hypothetical protein A3I97_03035 [Candidatus Taylorbacteria bacterium RIFCSPLOWO2_02_FULL_44_35]OHA43425.1 MAG: hypothetical protein A3G03_01255 [Candidatus Taylorbacteria bacterium RIFCSPLOWO2_12_FULL_44_15c]
MKFLTPKSFFATFAILLGFMVIPLGAEASSFIFQSKVITVEKGQTFTMPVVIDPSGEKNYTVRFTLGFPPDILEVTSFALASSWLAVPQPGYDLIDNKSGQFIKTAGFPKGFSVPEAFGTVTFLAKVAGEAIISVGPRSFILNAQNKSTLESRPQVRVVATVGSPPKASSITPLPDLPQGEQNIFDISLIPQIQTTGAGLASKVAPGEFLPLSVKLLNFGNRNRVDVTITYEITDLSGKTIYTSTETVAVETTATFVKTIQIPFETIPGLYIAKSSIVYQDQVAPATTEFPFVVERKLLGLFQSDFLRYGGITLLVGILMVLLGRALIKRRRSVRFAPFDYSDIPHGERTFYEILSDTIMEMRERVGDDALDIAANIDGLKIDKATGRVLALTERPSKIIATLVSEYEKLLGKKVSFSFRREKADL